MKIGLGTVQFGQDYGISNDQGRTTLAEARHVIDFARQNGISVLDTATSYGESELVLGEIAASDDGFSVVTKTPAFSVTTVGRMHADQLDESFRRSLDRLRRKRLYGLLIHHADDLLANGGERLWERMQRLKDQNQVEKIGVSVYTSAQIDLICERFTPDIVQLPINVFDQRLAKDGHLDALKSFGVEIHARSIFLQGLLLMDVSRLPPFFDPIKERIVSYRKVLSSTGISPLSAALGYIHSQPQIDVALCGVTNLSELQEIMASYRDRVALDFGDFEIDDERFLNPSNWRF